MGAFGYVVEKCCVLASLLSRFFGTFVRRRDMNSTLPWPVALSRTQDLPPTTSTNIQNLFARRSNNDEAWEIGPLRR